MIPFTCLAASTTLKINSGPLKPERPREQLSRGLQKRIQILLGALLCFRSIEFFGPVQKRFICVMAFLCARTSVHPAEAPSTVIISDERQLMGRQVREWHRQWRRHHQQTQWQHQRRDQLSVGDR